MLTAIAILERELGSIDYTRHILQKSDATMEGRGTLQELEARRQKALEMLEELHAQRKQRQPDAGRSARARPARRR